MRPIWSKSEPYSVQGNLLCTLDWKRLTDEVLCGPARDDQLHFRLQRAHIFTTKHVIWVRVSVSDKNIIIMCDRKSGAWDWDMGLLFHYLLRYSKSKRLTAKICRQVLNNWNTGPIHSDREFHWLSKEKNRMQIGQRFASSVRIFQQYVKTQDLISGRTRDNQNMKTLALPR